MAEFHISHSIFDYDDSGNDTSDWPMVLEWLEEHVGPELEKNGLTSEVYRKGQGWEIQTRKTASNKLGEVLDHDHKPVNIISWHLIIEDEKLAMMYALRWGVK